MWAEDSKFQVIKRDAEQWLESLPPCLQYTPDNLQSFASEKVANQFLFLHIVYNQIILFSNRFALPTPGVRTALPKDMPTEFVQTASRAAFEAANQISALVHEAMDHLVVAPFAGYCAFFSSTVHIYGAFSKNAQLEATSKQNLAWNVKYLTKMKKYWGMFHFVTENLRELYRRHADAARSGAGPKAGAGDGQDPAIFQYGDWFDRYPHGVSGTDYEEPSAGAKREPGSDAVLGQKSDLQTVEEFFSKLSPPSRAAHLQQRQQQEKKTAKRRRASKSQSISTTASGMPQAPQSSMNSAGQSFHQHGLQAQQMQNNMLSASQDFNNGSFDTSMRQHSIAFPPGFQAPPNPLLPTAPQHLMSQLDRQMVMNSYADLNRASNNNRAAQQAFQQPSSMLDAANQMDPFGLDAFPGHTANNNHGNGSGAGLWGDPSTAWFMPFNMEPPSIGDDGNLFGTGNGFDWAAFGGFGDLHTGLTPQPPPGEMDVVQQQQQQHDPTLSAEPGGNGLEGFEGLH